MLQRLILSILLPPVAVPIGVLKPFKQLLFLGMLPYIVVKSTS